MNTASFGQRLRELRLKSNMSLRELSEKLNISFSALGNYERNNREPNFDTLKKIADFFDVSLDYLLGLSDNPNIITFTDVFYGANYSTKRKIFSLIEQLNDEEQNAVYKYVNFLLSQRDNNLK